MAGFGRIAGIASLFVDGAPVTAKGALTYKPNGTKRDPIMALDGSLAGYQEEGDACFMSCDLLNDGSTTPGSLFGKTGIQVVANLANGMTVTGYSMTMMEPPEVKNDDATYSCKWIGPTVTESGP